MCVYPIYPKIHGCNCIHPKDCFFLWSEHITSKNLCYLILTMRLDTRLNFKRHLYDLYWKTASQLQHKCTPLASFKSDFDIFNFFRWFWICFSCLFCSSFTHFLVTLYSVSWSIVFKRRNYWYEVYLIIFQWKNVHPSGALPHTWQCHVWNIWMQKF